MTENKEKTILPEEKLDDVTGGGWSDIKDWFKKSDSRVSTQRSPLTEESAEQVAGGIDIGESKPIEVEVYNTWEAFPVADTEQPGEYQLHQYQDAPDGENFIAKFR